MSRNTVQPRTCDQKKCRDFPPLWGSPLSPIPPDTTCFAHERADSGAVSEFLRARASVDATTEFFELHRRDVLRKYKRLIIGRFHPRLYPREQYIRSQLFVFAGRQEKVRSPDLKSSRHCQQRNICWLLALPGKKCYLGNEKTEERLATDVFLAWIPHEITRSRPRNMIPTPSGIDPRSGDDDNKA